MKRFLQDTLPILLAMALLIAFAALDFMKCYAAPPVPIERLLRNGLTDAQVTKILSTDPNAIIHLNGATWRNMEFNTARYENVVRWLDIIGETNDFARLVVPLSQTNAVLTAKITSEIAFLEQKKRTCDELAEKYPDAEKDMENLKTEFQTRIEYLGGN